ncbi:hypothetical protein [Streptomyces sp. NPDC001076]
MSFSSRASTASGSLVAAAGAGPRGVSRTAFTCADGSAAAATAPMAAGATPPSGVHLAMALAVVLLALAGRALFTTRTGNPAAVPAWLSVGGGRTEVLLGEGRGRRT